MAKTFIKLRKKLWLPIKYAVLRETMKKKWGERTLDEIEDKLKQETELYFAVQRELHKTGARNDIIAQEAKINLLKWLLKREDQEINNI